jgi:hypothetical protein
MANDLATLLAANAPLPDPNLAPITQELQTAQGLTAQSLQGQPKYRMGAIADVVSGLAGAYLKGEANRDLTRYAGGGLAAVSKALPANHPLQAYLHSDNPFVQQMGLRMVPDAMKQVYEVKGLRSGEESVFGSGQPITGNTGDAAALAAAKQTPTLVARAGQTAAAENPALIDRAAGIAAAKSPYEPGGPITIPGGPSGTQTIQSTAATRKVINDRLNGSGTPPAAAPAGARATPAAQPTFNDRFTGVGGEPVKTPQYEGQIKLEEEAAKDFSENSTKHYNAATNLMGRLTTMDHNIEMLGSKWMGANANAKGEFGKQWNGMLDTAGVKGYHIDPTKIATWEEFNKESSRAGMELINANFGGSREAASIIKMGTEAVPAAQQTYLGAKYNAASIRAASQREIDLHEFKSGLLQQGKSIVGSDVAFNKTHPAESYAMQAITSQIPPDAVAHLRANPALAPHFDKQFGPGTAAFVMGAK